MSEQPTPPTLPKLIEHGRISGTNYVKLDEHHSPQRMASMLNKAAKYSRTKITSKSTVGRPGKGKGSKVSKRTGRTIVGKHFQSGGPKK